jgi:hypothetical protein
MTTYFSEYPRDFANEYHVYAVAADDLADFQEHFPDASRITRKEAIRLGWSRPREAKKYGEQWFGGFWDDGLAPCGFEETLASALEECQKATSRLVAARNAPVEYGYA